MKKLLLIIILVITLKVSAQEVKIVDFDQLQEKITHTETQLTVFNFWATWCGPCIKELPYFDELELHNPNVKVYLVSVDFQNQLERVKAFVAKKGLKSQVLFLDEKDPDNYLSKVNKDWTGAIPATLFVTDLGKTYFYEKAFTKEELTKTINQYLN